MFDDFQRYKTTYQIVFMAAERMPRGIHVVFEHMHCGMRPMSGTKPLLGVQCKVAHHQFASCIHGQSIHGIAGLGRGIFRMRSDIKIQSRPVFNIRIGRSRGGNDRLEHHHCRLAGVAWHIRTGHTDAVFRFNAENTSERMNLTQRSRIKR